MHRQLKSKKGFTLVELVLAIAIIVLISGVVAGICASISNSFITTYNIDDSSDYASIIRFGKTLSEGLLTFTSGNVNIEELDQEMDQIVDDIINSDDIDDYADYRNYLSYDILFSNDTIKAIQDANGNGELNAADATVILQYAAYLGAGGTGTLQEFLASQTA